MEPGVIQIHSCSDLENLILDDRQHFARRDARQHAGDGVEQAGHWNEADDRGDEEKGGEERQKEIVRQLGREAQAVVCEDLASRPLQEFGPTEGNSERLQDHRARRDRPSPVPTVGVQAGASLAGNESADASCTKSSSAQPSRSIARPIHRRASRRSTRR